MSRPVSLDDLGGAYKRTSTRIYRILEDGYDFAVANLIIDTLDRDALVVDAAFFVLAFGQIESRLNAIAATHLKSDAERAALRQTGIREANGAGVAGPRQRGVAPGHRRLVEDQERCRARRGINRRVRDTGNIRTSTPT
jgi:hypothetical protein